MIGPFIISIILLIPTIVLIIKTKQLQTKVKLLELQKEQETQTLEAGYLSKLEELQKALEESKQLAMVTRQSENAIMVMNEKGDILWVNDSFERMYEYKYHEFIATLGSNIRQTSFNPRIEERINLIKTKKIPVVYEALNITRSGKEIWTRTSFLPLLDEKSTVIGMVTVDSNIHKRVIAGNSLISNIHTFNDKIEKIAEQLNVMVELTDALFERIDISQRRIDRTDQIIEFVKGISDQTKILGINASIEAHTAGNYGKGFRVIANEIVNISNVTINSMREINELIGKVKRSSDKLGNVRERSQEAIDAHHSLISELKQKINEVQEVIMEMK
ncbi:MAG: methyl-accepting chemotaxis protein [Bacteroidota bacterium]|nr:methyl-accepting chemotaxis protein [Bacteroidota bacterium]